MRRVLRVLLLHSWALKLAIVAVSTAAAILAAPAAAFELGLQDDRLMLRDEGIGRESALDFAEDLGVGAVRMNVIWHRVHERGFGELDAAVEAIRARGMSVQLTIMGTPRYEHPLDARLTYLNPRPGLFAYFADLIARRYRGRVRTYSIWNEPNGGVFLDGENPLRAYHAIYRAGYRAIKRVDQRNRVLLGELCPCSNASDWLVGLGARGRLHADGIAVHPYQDVSVPPGRPFPQGRNQFTISNSGYLRRVLRILAKRGRITTPLGRRLPIYYTEFGYQTARPRTAPGVAMAADHQRRGELLVEAITHARRAGARQLVLYQLEQTGHEWDTGIVDRDGAPTAAYAAVAGEQVEALMPRSRILASRAGVLTAGTR